MSAKVLLEVTATAGALGLPAPVITAAASVYQDTLEAGFPDVALATLLFRERVAGLGHIVAAPQDLEAVIDEHVGRDSKELI